MAVLQISKIQVRRGQEYQTGAPLLSGGEFAWSIDAQRLYIGNGSVSEGAPSIGNTRILTEHDSSTIFDLANAYEYGSTFNNVVLQTGAEVGNPTLRSIKSKLDDVLTVKDFGAVGDGVTDDTLALQRAITQTFVNSANYTLTSSRKTLKIPAGTYLISNVLNVPPYATIIGDGKGKTIIKQASTQNLPIFQFCSFDPTVTSNNNSLNDKLIAGPSNISLHQISSNGSQILPTDIAIKSMTLLYNDPSLEGNQPMIYANCSSDSQIYDVEFKGAGVIVPGQDFHVPALRAIDIQSCGVLSSTTASGYTTNLQIANCVFFNIGIGIYSNYNANNLSIKDNRFQYLDRGIVFGETLGGPTQTTGPTNVLIEHNKFDMIYNQAIFVNSNTNAVSTLVTSANNDFTNCGNHYTDDNTQFTPVIAFYSPGNSSKDDYFARQTTNNAGTVTGYMYPNVAGNAVIVSRNPTRKVLTVSSATQALAIVAKGTGDQYIHVEYIATSGTNFRRGELKINATSVYTPVGDSVTVNLPIVDSFGYTSSEGGLGFSAVWNSGNANLPGTAYTNAVTIGANNATVNTTIEYILTRMY